ncbi:hypothetical protein K439DRAFT_1638933 [Ramaria rubella]|nr:hypothetical protein K439DRAFT_1638933 [Ramaria rubella]
MNHRQQRLGQNGQMDSTATFLARSTIPDVRAVQLVVAGTASTRIYNQPIRIAPNCTIVLAPTPSPSSLTNRSDSAVPATPSPLQYLSLTSHNPHTPTRVRLLEFLLHLISLVLYTRIFVLMSP